MSKELTAEQKEILGVKDETETTTETVTEQTSTGTETKEEQEAVEKTEQVIEQPEETEADNEKKDDKKPDEEPEVQEVKEAPIQEPVVIKAAVNQYGSAVEQQIFSAIEDYIAAMAPRKPVRDTDIVKYQVSLYRAIQATIDRTGDNFNEIFSKVLSKFEEHKAGVFHETRVFRGFDNINLPEEDRKALMYLINLIKLTSNPQSRKLAIKQVDLETSLQYGVTELGRRRVLSFFGK